VSNQEKFFGTAREVLLVFLVIVIGVLVLLNVEYYFLPPKTYTVQCLFITPSGPVKTIEFEDNRVREENGVIKGNTKVYRLNVNEACLIEEIKK
jgi:hypothetical protein